LIVPLVKSGDSPITIGNTHEGEGAIGGALGEGEVFTIGISDAHEALGPGEGIARTTAVDSFVWWPAQAFARDRALIVLLQ